MNINGEMIIYDDFVKHQYKVLKDIVALLNSHYTSTILLGINKKNPHINMSVRYPPWIINFLDQDRIYPNPVNNIKITYIGDIVDIEIIPGNDAPYYLTNKHNKTNKRIYIRENNKTRLISAKDFKVLYQQY